MTKETTGRNRVQRKITHILGDIIYDDYELRNGTSTKLLRIIILGEILPLFKRTRFYRR